jgi:MFS family permease
VTEGRRTGRTAGETVAVLFSRNFLPYVLGNVGSGTAMWFQLLGQSILVYRLTHSAFLLGVLGFCQLGAVVLLAPWAGSLADQFDRRHVVAVCEVASTVITAAMALITAAGHASTELVIVFALALSVKNAFETPALMALVPTLVTERHFATALALNSVTFNLGRAIGPVAAAATINAAGFAWTFAIGAFLSVPLAIGVLVVRQLEPHVRPPVRPRLRESVALVRRDQRLAALLYVIAAVVLCTVPPVTLGPAFVSRALHHRDSLAGLLVGGFGAGAVLAAFTISHRLRGSRVGIAATLGLTGVSLAAFSFAPSLGLALAFLVPLGFGYLSTNVQATSRLQTEVEPSQRGRIMALWSISFLGVQPFASLAIGGIASAAGVRVASVVLALPAVVGAAAILLVRSRERGRVRAWAEV